jgi:predicted transcriptional regulator
MECLLNKENCAQTECRQWIDYKEDLNCCLIAVEKNGRMTLDEVSKRLGISYVRVKQLETKALNKLQKKVI